jgi:hypothetical protein
MVRFEATLQPYTVPREVIRRRLPRRLDAEIRGDGLRTVDRSPNLFVVWFAASIVLACDDDPIRVDNSLAASSLGPRPQHDCFCLSPHAANANDGVPLRATSGDRAGVRVRTEADPRRCCSYDLVPRERAERIFCSALTRSLGSYSSKRCA